MSYDRRASFSDAFYRQALSDWQTYRLLAAIADLPRCHALHYLQMASEKLAKAYRIRDTGSELDEIAGRHTGFAKFINSFLRSPTSMEEYEGRLARHPAVCATAARFAREIERLAPAVDRVTSPEDTEYPWERGEAVVAPCEYDYPALSLLSGAGARTFLNLFERAFRDYERIAIR